MEIRRNAPMRPQILTLRGRFAGARTVLVLAVTATLLLPAAARAAWQEIVGGPSPIAHSVTTEGANPSLADVGGTLYVAWGANVGGTDYDVYVSKLDVSGISWIDVGGALNHTPTDNAFRPSLASIGGVPWVAWIEYDGTSQKLRVARLKDTGDGWIEVVGGANPLNHDPTQNAWDPSIADVGGVPYVAWAEEPVPNTNEALIRVSRLNADGTAWVEVVGGSNPINQDPSAQAGGPSLIGIDGVPYVAWQEGYGDPKIHVSKLNDTGTAWTEIGTGAAPINHDPTKYASSPSLTAIGGVPWIAWSEFDDMIAQIRVARLNDSGTGWTEVVGGAQPVNLSGGSASDPSLTSIGGVPYVAFSQYDPGNAEIRVKRLDDTGTAWVEVDGGPSPINENPDLDGVTPSLTVSNGVPVVAWSQAEETVPMQVRVSRRVVGPDTVITSGPTTTNSAFAIFEFAAVPPTAATFECALDGGAFDPCTSPCTSPALVDGSHLFEVRATNASGTDSTPASRAFLVDRTAPNAQIKLNGAAPLPGSYLTGVVVDVAATDPTPGSGIASRLCLVDPPSPPSTLAAFGAGSCGGMVVTSGDHTAYGIAVDKAGNTSTIVSATFHIVPLPDTTITGGPGATTYSAPGFTFTSTPAGAIFECSIDGAAFQSCAPPAVVYGLPLGAHTFRVRAVLSNGATDPTPASYDFVLATRTVTASCTFLVPWLGDYKDNVNNRCLILEDVCPARSICTADQHVLAEDADTNVGVFAGSLFWNPSDKVVAYAASQGCVSHSTSAAPGTTLCPVRFSNSVLGTGQPVRNVCDLGGFYTNIRSARGDDSKRRISCETTYIVRPVESLSTTVTAKTLSVYAPAPGSIVIVPNAPLAKEMATVEQASAAPKPPFRTVKKKVKAEGPVDIKLGLSPALAKQLRTTGTVTVSVAMTFTPADGGAPQTRVEDVTLSKPPKRSIK